MGVVNDSKVSSNRILTNSSDNQVDLRQSVTRNHEFRSFHIDSLNAAPHPVAHAE